jgi:hypothetical protein
MDAGLFRFPCEESVNYPKYPADNNLFYSRVSPAFYIQTVDFDNSKTISGRLVQYRFQAIDRLYGKRIIFWFYTQPCQ